MAPMAAGESGRVQKLGTMAIPVSACCEASLPHVFSKTQFVCIATRSCSSRMRFGWSSCGSVRSRKKTMGKFDCLSSQLNLLMLLVGTSALEVCGAPCAFIFEPLGGAIMTLTRYVLTCAPRVSLTDDRFSPGVAAELRPVYRGGIRSRQASS